MLIFCFHGFTQFHLNINKPLHAGRGSSSFKWMIFEYISWVCPLSQALYQDHFLFTNQTQPKIMLLKSNFPCRSQFSFQSIRSLITGNFGGWREKISALWLLITSWLSRYFQVTHQFSFYLYVLPIVLFSILYNTPKFFELEVAYSDWLRRRGH